MDLELLTKVADAAGVSGFEEEIQAVVTDVLAGCCDEVSQDRLGNVIGLKRSAVEPDNRSRPMRVVLAAHSDEIGMMVKHITPEGYIKFQPIGGLHAPSIVSQQVIVHGKEKVRGVIAPDHGKAESVPALLELMIEI